MRFRPLIAMAILFALSSGATLARATYKPEFDAAFHLLYETKFEEARMQFRAWQHAHPDDPLGHAAEAGSYLYEEFYRQGVLTSEFFLENKRLLEGIEGQPDPGRRDAFLAANTKAQELARKRLHENPRDPDALFVLTITTGMLADYAGLIEKRHLRSLMFVREAEEYAGKLLAVDPNSADAYLALGAANYIIGSLPAHKRFFLWFGGIRGDRGRGMMQLETAALRGHYLKPFAKILLALVSLREKQVTKARQLLEQLVTEFPANPLFARELARLEKAAISTGSGP